jgi:hypothetical protein
MENNIDIISLQETIMNQYITEVTKNIDDTIEHSLRTFAVPPIKGEITKAKIKWRGIRICKQTDGLKFITWVEQRGLPISPKIVIDGQFNKNI